MPANGRRGRPQGKCHREQTAGRVRLLGVTRQARVKRWGKSPPRDRQRKRHGKPHREQDQIGAARRATGSGVSASPPGSVARGARRRASQRNGHPSPPWFAGGRGQNPAYRPSDLPLPARFGAMTALPATRRDGAKNGPAWHAKNRENEIGPTLTPVVDMIVLELYSGGLLRCVPALSLFASLIRNQNG